MIKFRIIFLIIFVTSIILGAFYLNLTWHKALAQKSNQTMIIAKASEISLNGEMLRQLRGLPEDVGTVPYESIKSRLVKLVEIDSEIRFAYLYTEKEGKIYILADSEPVDSPDYSPPGQEYTEASEEMKRPIKDKVALITKPVTDRWGNWVSVLVPMIDDKTGKVIAIFGIDYPAEDWHNVAVKQTFQGGIIVVICLLLLGSFYLIINNIIKLKGESLKVLKIKKEQESILDAIPAWVFYKDTNNNFIRVNKAFADVMGKPKQELEGKSCFDIFPKEQAEAFLKDDLEVISSEKSKKDIVEKMNSPEGLRWVQTDKIILRDEGGKKIGIIGFSLDITDKKKIEDEIKNNNQQLERVNKLMVGRELEMINLKKELANLKNPK